MLSARGSPGETRSGAGWGDRVCADADSPPGCQLLGCQPRKETSLATVPNPSLGVLCTLKGPGPEAQRGGRWWLQSRPTCEALLSPSLPSVYLPISSPSSPAGKRGRGPQERRVREDLALGFILQTFTEC